VGHRARNQGGTFEYIVDAEADLAAIPNPRTSEFALAMSEKTIWVFTGSAWEAIGGAGGGAPTNADYLVGTANGSLSAEIVAGTTPGGELGGTWDSPTVDATHAGSTHVTDHGALTGLADDDHTQYATNVEFDDHNARHEPGGADPMTVDAAAATGSLRTLGTGAAQAAAGDHTHGGGSGVDVEEGNVAVGTATVLDFGAGLDVAFAAGEADITVDLSEVTAFTDHSARHENGGADEISIAGLDGVSNALQSHLDDAADAHDASAISILDAAADFDATDVEGALAELQSDAEAHIAAGDPHTGYRLESADHTHASSGLQAGTIDHGVLTGLTDDDHTQYLKETDVAAKGDIYAATADNTVGVLTVGANDTILMADSAEATGLKWSAAAAAAQIADVADAEAAGTSDTWARGDHVHSADAYRKESESGTFTVGAFFDDNGSTLATGVRPIWRAPFACTVTQVRAYVDTGTTTVVNACKDATGTNNFCSADITIDPADAWEAGTVNQNQSVASGDTVGVEIVTAGTATQLTIQIEFTRP